MFTTSAATAPTLSTLMSMRPGAVLAAPAATMTTAWDAAAQFVMLIPRASPAKAAVPEKFRKSPVPAPSATTLRTSPVQTPVPVVTSMRLAPQVRAPVEAVMTRAWAVSLVLVKAMLMTSPFHAPEKSTSKTLPVPVLPSMSKTGTVIAPATSMSSSEAPVEPVLSRWMNAPVAAALEVMSRIAPVVAAAAISSMPHPSPDMVCVPDEITMPWAVAAAVVNRMFRTSPVAAALYSTSRTLPVWAAEMSTSMRLPEPAPDLLIAREWAAAAVASFRASSPWSRLMDWPLV